MKTWKNKDLTGQKFGRLTVLHDTGKRTEGNQCIIYRCQCPCGNYRNASSEALRRGVAKSCRACGNHRRSYHE